MNDSQIRQLIQQEVHKLQQANKFNAQPIPRHTHNGSDSPPVNQSDIVPGLSIEGSITFAQQTTYKIGITFNPSVVLIHGNVIGPSGERFIITGNARIGNSFYLQPSNSVSVVTGGPQQTVIQSNTYFGADSGGALHTLVDEGHIINVFYSGTVFFRATITKYSNRALYVQVDTLVSGWEANISWTIT